MNFYIVLDWPYIVLTPAFETAALIFFSLKNQKTNQSTAPKKYHTQIPTL